MVPIFFFLFWGCQESKNPTSPASTEWTPHNPHSFLNHPHNSSPMPLPTRRVPVIAVVMLMATALYAADVIATATGGACDVGRPIIASASATGVLAWSLESLRVPSRSFARIHTRTHRISSLSVPAA